MSLRGWAYRIVMRIAHRFDWHYAPSRGPIEPDGDYQRWCQWCGFRQSYRKDGALNARLAHGEGKA